MESEEGSEWWTANCSPQSVRRWVFSAWGVYVVGTALVVAGVLVSPLRTVFPPVAFALTFATLLMNVVHASLTRQIRPLRLLVGMNVVVLAAAASTNLSEQYTAAIVAGVPLLSYYCYWSWLLSSTPPREGEALRASKDFSECRLLNKVSIVVVIVVEFCTFNSLAFNPALGVWTEVCHPPTFAQLSCPTLPQCSP